MLSKALLEIAGQLAPTIQSWPRRQPGLLMVGGKVLRYADMHSFYHQTRQIFGQRLYSFACSNPAPLILDCGAHIGLASLFFKERFPDARIRAFEADAVIADICRSNFASFATSGVEMTEAAVWTHGDGVSFKHTDDDAGHVSDAAGATTVPSVRLRTLLEGERVDLLKLDVEGAEFALFEDCGPHLAAADHIVMEVHAMAEHQAKIGPLLSQLERLGFRYVLGDLHQATWLPSKGRPPFEHCATEKFILTVFAWHSRTARDL